MIITCSITVYCNVHFYLFFLLLYCLFRLWTSFCFLSARIGPYRYHVLSAFISLLILPFFGISIACWASTDVQS